MMTDNSVGIISPILTTSDKYRSAEKGSSHNLTDKEISDLRENFQKFDTNGDGDIDVVELAKILDIVGEAYDHNSLNNMISTADKDGDGKMSFEEFIELVKHSRATKTKSALVSAIKKAGRVAIPSKYARLQTTRLVFSTSQNRIDTSTEKEEEEDVKVIFAVRASWVVNVTLLIMKIFCYYISNSKSILAALADSVVDLVSQIILSVGDYYTNKPCPDYPIGRSKIESLSVLACAGVMIVASVEVIQDAAMEIYDGALGVLPEIPPGYIVYLILGIGVGMKLSLFFYCQVANRGPDGKPKSDMLGALAEDHLNDVFSNVAAMITMSISQNTIAWWVDPVGCILISLIICYRWIAIMKDQMEKVTGLSAPEEYLNSLKDSVFQYDSTNITGVDRVIAYYSGAKYNVEVDLLLPKNLTVDVAHDIAIGVQGMLEDLPDVDRANVHVDFKTRDVLEHKVDRELAKGLVKAGGDIEAGRHASGKA